MSKSPVDVVIVGGGPVGLAAAIEARMAGLSTTVIEQRDGIIDKACGEGLMPGALPLLERLGVQPVGRPIAGIRYADASRSIDHRFAGVSGLGVRRTELHSALLARAAEMGVTIEHAKVRAIAQDGDTVSAAAEGDAAPLLGRWLLGCDGLHSSVARLSGLARVPRERGRRYGIRQHFAVSPWSDLVEVHYGKSAELYVTPVGDGLVGIAMLAAPGVKFDDAVDATPAIRDRLAGASVASERRGAGPFRQKTAARTAGRVMLVGDASGYVDALTGEGLRLGFAQATAAITCIQTGASQRYERDWLAVTRDFRMLTAGLVAWAGSPLRCAIVPAAVRAPRLFGAVVERLGR